MASHTESSGFDGLLRWLATYRLAIYLGGLLAIATPRLLRTVGGPELGPTVRTVLVVTAMGAMILTYLGERRTRGTTNRRRGDAATGRARLESTPADGGNGPETESEPERDADAAESDAATGTPQYSRRTRAVFAAGILGVVFGIYVALETSVPAGLLFVFGAILFVQSAYRRERGGESE